MADENKFQSDKELPVINRVQPHNYNVMPDGMLEAISPTDLVLMSLLKDAPEQPPDEESSEDKNR